MSRAMFGSLPWATQGRIRSNVAPSQPIMKTREAGCLDAWITKSLLQRGPDARTIPYRTRRCAPRCGDGVRPGWNVVEFVCRPHGWHTPFDEGRRARERV